MIAAKKLSFRIGQLKGLLFMTAMLLLMVCPVTVVKASEVDNTTVSTDASTNEDSTKDTSAATAEELAATADGTVLGEGYFVDEQGQVYYDDTIVTVEEPVIEDIEDQEDSETDDSANTEDTDKKTDSDTKNAKAQTKAEKDAATKKPAYSEADLRLLACLVYSEAGNQSYNGMLAVANVVLNRVDSDVYWHVNTIKEVIYDRKWAVQFSVTIKNRKTGLSALDRALKAFDTGKFSGPNPAAEKKAMARALKAAREALEGKNNIGNYLCFTNKREAGNVKRHYSNYKVIGDHIFYRTK